jgi:hypothetical protein
MEISEQEERRNGSFPSLVCGVSSLLLWRCECRQVDLYFDVDCQGFECPGLSTGDASMEAHLHCQMVVYEVLHHLFVDSDQGEAGLKRSLWSFRHSGLSAKQ